jgi:cation diffusion facilitator family transporter
VTPPPPNASNESRATVLLALAANAGIALAKLVAGLLSGSTVMLAEAGHSLADTVNQLFLLASLRRGGRAADPTHPFGYGKERFFWSLLAAVGIFVAGGLASIYQGVHELTSPARDSTSFLLNYVVLAVAVVLEGASLLKALHQTRAQARTAGRGTLQHVRLSPDPTVKTVVSEDGAAVAGLLLAFAGLGLHQLTGDALWDAAAAIGVGLLLVMVAFLLGRDTKELLIGEATDPATRLALYDRLAAYPEVDGVVDLMTMLLGPDSLLVAARIDLADGLSTDEVEDFSTRVEVDLVAAHPEVSAVFLDATRAVGPMAERAERLARVMDRRRAGHPT